MIFFAVEIATLRREIHAFQVRLTGP